MFHVGEKHRPTHLNYVDVHHPQMWRDEVEVDELSCRPHHYIHLCVCMCVCEREGKEGGREGGRRREGKGGERERGREGGRGRRER